MVEASNKCTLDVLVVFPFPRLSLLTPHSGAIVGGVMAGVLFIAIVTVVVGGWIYRKYQLGRKKPIDSVSV